MLGWIPTVLTINTKGLCRLRVPFSSTFTLFTSLTSRLSQNGGLNFVLLNVRLKFVFVQQNGSMTAHPATITIKVMDVPMILTLASIIQMF